MSPLCEVRLKSITTTQTLGDDAFPGLRGPRRAVNEAVERSSEAVRSSNENAFN